MHNDDACQPRRLPPARRTPPPVSVILANEGKSGFRAWEMETADGSLHWVVEHYGPTEVPFPEIIRRYNSLQHGDPLRPAVWEDLGQVPDPHKNPIGYRKAQWWTQDWLLDGHMLRDMRGINVVHPYVPRARGPLLGPSGPPLPPLPPRRPGA